MRRTWALDARMVSHPILHDIRAELRGTVTVLRCPEPGDGARLHEAVVESLAELREWPASIPWALNEPSVDASEIFCRTSKAEFIKRARLPYLVFDAESSALIGCMGVVQLDWHVPKFEIGFWSRTSCHGKGFMTDALKTLVEYLLENVGARRIECFTDECNTKARALCERAGLRHEATLLHDRVDPDGRLRNTVIYAVIRG